MAGNELPFGIDFVVEQDLIPNGFVKHFNNEGYSITCPFCEKKGLTPDRHHKLSINVSAGVAHCFRCNSGFGILSLHQALTGLDKEGAKKDLLNRFNGLPSNVKANISSNKVQHKQKEESRLYPASIEIRNEVYRKLLDQLALSKKHHDDLIKRGLNDEEIEKGMYRSVPIVGFETFAKKCFDYETLKTLKNHREWGIPGFYDVKDEPKLIKQKSGYFIPVLDEFGRISELIIRFDELPEDASEQEKDYWSKYKPFTSDFAGKKHGCSTTGCENIHYAGDWFKTPESCMLTEGILKANVASCIAGRLKGQTPRPILAVDGVNKVQNLSFELLKLKDYGLKKVVIALDMDYKKKPQVKDALIKIQQIIIECGLEPVMFTWPEQYKGLDDYLSVVYQHRHN